MFKVNFLLFFLTSAHICIFCFLLVMKRMEDPEDRILTLSCRICFEEHTPFVLPCKCTNPVHLKCLNKWRYQFPLEHQKRQNCEVCLAPYNLPDYEKYLVIALFCFWYAVSVSGVVALPMLPNEFQFFAGILLLCCMVVAQYYFQRACNVQVHKATFLNMSMLLLGGFVTLYILELPENDSSIGLMYMYTVVATYTVIQCVQCWRRRRRL